MSKSRSGAENGPAGQSVQRRSLRIVAWEDAAPVAERPSRAARCRSGDLVALFGPANPAAAEHPLRPAPRPDRAGSVGRPEPAALRNPGSAGPAGSESGRAASAGAGSGPPTGWPVPRDPRRPGSVPRAGAAQPNTTSTRARAPLGFRPPTAAPASAPSPLDFAPRPASVQPETGNPPAPPPRLTADAISHEAMVHPERPVPTMGWRAAVHLATEGRVNLGVGRAERRRRALLDRVGRPVSGSRRIAVASLKGGVGKTTVAACLGLTLAEHRGDGVVALDADPDAGTLGERLTGEPVVTIRDLLPELSKVRSLSELGAYTSLAGRLRVLAGDQDAAAGGGLRAEEYERVCAALARFFDIVITDSGTGLGHPAMVGTLALADRLIVVGSPTVDGASRASKTLDWLLAHGHERLAAEAVLVLCADRTSGRVNRRRLRRHFAERCRHVVEIPADPHLHSGGLIDPALLRPATRDAYLRLAAVIADGFAR